LLEDKIAIFFIANLFKAYYKHPDLPCDGSSDCGTVLYPHWYLQMTCHFNSKFFAIVSVGNAYCQKNIVFLVFPSPVLIAVSKHQDNKLDNSFIGIES
jgi:hypothetical protein